MKRTPGRGRWAGHVWSTALAALSMFAGPWAVSAAHAAEIACPRSIVETPSVGGDTTGWQVLAEGGTRPLRQVEVYFGEPAQRASQVPDLHRRKTRGETQVWILRRAPGDVFHVACAYEGTTALLWRAVPDDARRCTARYERLKGVRAPRLVDMICR